MNIKEYLNIAKEKFAGLPSSFKFLFLVKFDKAVSMKMKSKRYGVSVDAYQSETYQPTGHYKNISKIVDYKIIQEKNG
ncbi:hypothetical protein [Pedobacter sp. R20-19]|uniref:hypothetical protein n=1 Tax=Pedobacter sp. R20-19 TaxID=1270196 RepID=UPI0004935DA5|nr:hypothetical protein [Pedobacter sp. R20-19]